MLLQMRFCSYDGNSTKRGLQTGHVRNLEMLLVIFSSIFPEMKI
jgi:hypothetical protein